MGYGPYQVLSKWPRRVPAPASPPFSGTSDPGSTAVRPRLTILFGEVKIGDPLLVETSNRPSRRTKRSEHRESTGPRSAARVEAGEGGHNLTNLIDTGRAQYREHSNLAGLFFRTPVSEFSGETSGSCQKTRLGTRTRSNWSSFLQRPAGISRSSTGDLLIWSRGWIIMMNLTGTTWMRIVGPDLSLKDLSCSSVDEDSGKGSNVISLPHRSMGL